MFSLTIATDNAAFCDENGTFEIARILREIADDFENGRNGRNMSGNAKIRDVNGNSVGTWQFAVTLQPME